MDSKGNRILKIRKSIDKQWSQYFLKFIKESPDKPWDWWCISRNPNITWQIVRDNPMQNWDWRGISRNQIYNYGNN